jgi:hypothetical protein
MTSEEKAALATHAGHEVMIVDYMSGEPIRESDGDGRFCLECLDCSVILLGDRVVVGAETA